MILDSFQVNLDERGTKRCWASARACLASYHVSDSNRGGIGSGGIDFPGQHQTLAATGFDEPVMLEIVLPHRTPEAGLRTYGEWRAFDHEVTRRLALRRAMA